MHKVCSTLRSIKLLFVIDLIMSTLQMYRTADYADTCPTFAPFSFWLRHQCPPFSDLRCVVGLPGDAPTPPGQLNCGTVDDQPSPQLQVISASEMLRLVKVRDPWGRPMCLLTLFYSPDCVFSAKVADTFFTAAQFLPKLRIVAVDVSVGGKGTESLISHYGISSTPVIALWQDGFPRYRLYDDYSQLESLFKVIRAQTDLRPSEKTALKIPVKDAEEKSPDDESNVNAPLKSTKEEFLSQFHYLKEDLGFDWYLLAAIVTCIVNALYFILSSQKGRALLQQNFPGVFAFFN